MMPKVDTFEHDIAEEIKRKDASAREISEARGDIGNDPHDTEKKPVPVLLISLVTLFIICLLGMIGLLYFYFTDSLLPPSQASVPITENNIPKTVKTLGSVSPTLDREIGRYVTGLEKQDAGYILSINSYPPVFAYMVRNEDDYIHELASAVAGVTIGATPGGEVTAVSTSTPVSNAQTSTTTPSSSATSTKNKTVQATSTPVTSTTTLLSTTTVQTNPPYYYDVTISNQNMRVWKNGNETVVYAFITTNKIAISRTTEGILALKSVILR